ncbi:type IV pilus assembly protein PilB [Ectothiorhodosinus mongolicus]|uniref:Type IV pilus assembly protein PilB n=1 Tax=Ectothiorhodosinus mongolicus TaxID=233100 RepID=A0A1R3VPW6_9GAMM|nr:ATPase, T2SS/T4P/T4SS family [Ectothiorhodosinus mongolicus]ULX56667.1 type IV-A pilus assembly ATPase PilB [Ectothiorhodosinus mongolicus]SIT66728.1 type IV pilus assembly protein PilB [Ectothiorhodosinus mongolicus]
MHSQDTLQWLQDSLDSEAHDLRREDVPIVKLLNELLLEAIQAGASDVHFELHDQQLRVRFRIDGLLYTRRQMPQRLAARIHSRLKVMGRMDIAERRLPQDGRARLRFGHSDPIDLRISSCPTVHGEKLVVRILDNRQTGLGVDELGMSAAQAEDYRKALTQHQGMILVTGPTGAGKTVTLYAGLKQLNSGERNIATAEDPVEITLPGINQLNVHPVIGLNFARALRAFLRQDPDVIMVGEIRDTETAEMAIKAAQTGHLVLSTLHTNNAPQTLERLAHMGIPAYGIAASVSLIIAQRLLRRLCPHCRQVQTLPIGALRDLGFSDSQLAENIQLFAAQGCEHCVHGYRGRIGIYQHLPVSAAIRDVILSGGNSHQIATCAAREGMRSLYEEGLLRAAQGLTSLAEVQRLLNTSR